MLELKTLLRCVPMLLTGCTAPLAASPPASPPAESIAFARWEPPRLDSAHRAKLDRLVPRLDTLYTTLQRESHAPGMAVGIVLGGEIVYAKGFGLRDLERKTPFDADTPFRIASVTKGFIAMAILKLRDEGRLDLDAPAARYYPPIGKLAYPTRDAPRVTVRHLLTHASGMPEDNPWADVTENLSEPDLARLLDGGQMARVPGIHYEYSNVGWAVLGRVIERVSGVPAQEYVRREILGPLGMRHSGWHAGDFEPGAVATGYRGREGARDADAPRVVAPTEELGVLDAAGGLYTTARDLARYVSFQVTAWPPRDDAESGPLRRSSVREMQQGARPYHSSERLGPLVGRNLPWLAGSVDGHTTVNASAYGFGLNTRTTCEDDSLVEHSGGLPGYLTNLVLLPDRGFGMVVLLNDERAYSSAVADTLRILRAEGLLAKGSIAPAPALVGAPAAIDELLARWTGDRALATFEPTFFRYQTIGALEERFAQLRRDHGSCHLDGPLQPANRLRGRWREVCERGSLTFAVAVAPGSQPRLQGMEIREDLPPGPALDRAGAAFTDLLAHGDTKAAEQLLAAPADAAKIEVALSRLAASHGPCKLGRAVESDGKTRAVYELACPDRPVDLTVIVDAAGKVTSVVGRPSRSEATPNCAD